MKTTKLTRKAGFTLVEIMIVVAIIGLLAAIAIPNFLRARSTSQMNACIENLRQIDGAKQQWGLEAGKGSSDTPAASDLGPYMQHGLTTPTVYCPLDSTHTFTTSYSPNNLSQNPTCLKNGTGQIDSGYIHVLPTS